MFPGSLTEALQLSKTARVYPNIHRASLAGLFCMKRARRCTWQCLANSSLSATGTSANRNLFPSALLHRQVAMSRWTNWCLQKESAIFFLSARHVLSTWSRYRILRRESMISQCFSNPRLPLAFLPAKKQLQERMQTAAGFCLRNLKPPSTSWLACSMETALRPPPKTQDLSSLPAVNLLGRQKQKAMICERTWQVQTGKNLWQVANAAAIDFFWKSESEATLHLREATWACPKAGTQTMLHSLHLCGLEDLEAILDLLLFDKGITTWKCEAQNKKHGHRSHFLGLMWGLWRCQAKPQSRCMILNLAKLSKTSEKESWHQPRCLILRCVPDTLKALMLPHVWREGRNDVWKHGKLQLSSKAGTCPFQISWIVILQESSQECWHQLIHWQQTREVISFLCVFSALHPASFGSKWLWTFKLCLAGARLGLGG